MKSKAQVSEEHARREAIESRNQGESIPTIGGHIPQTSYEMTKAWLNNRSKKAAALRMESAKRFITMQVPGMEPAPRAPYVPPTNPADIGDVVEDKGYLGNKVVQRIKRIVGV
jgi:hypothetical protein